MESATQTALRDADLAELDELTGPEPAAEERFGPWARADYLLAQLIDAVREGVYVASIAGQLEPKPEPPRPVSRPGVARRRRQEPGLSEAAVLYLSKLRPTGG